MLFAGLIQNLGIPVEQTSLASQPHLNPELSSVAAIATASAGTISFIESPKGGHWVQQSAASALVLPKSEHLQQQASDRGIAWVATEDPRLLFAQVLEVFYQPWQPEPGLHPTAVIHPSVRFGKGVSIGAHGVIHGGCVLGDGVCLHANVVVYPQVTLGDRTVLHANCVIHEGAVIGADCVIHSGAVIGAEGFGFVPTAAGWVKMPQSGRTVLEDRVEVGCNCAIDRPAVGETRIGEGTKLDNLVQVGHGCQIGKHCVLVSQVGLAGGVQVGDRAILAGQVGIAEKVKIGAGAIVTAQSGVMQDVSPGEVVSGYPAMPNKLWLKTSALIKRLPELLKRS
jgi:UDP-3-O-[3-hydroxymyristoyl] glucosamine N-acyltransferase